MNKLEGWIKLHRKITEHEIWADVTTFRLFMLLLLKSTHQDYDYRGMKLKPGQFIRSYSKLAEDLSYREGRGYKQVSKNTISKAIKKLITNGMVSVQETEVGTMFTVLNYQYYQGFAEFEKANGERLTERTENEVRTNGELEQEHNNKRNIYIGVVEYLNEQAKTKFRHTSRKTQQLIKARFNEGFDIDDFKKVIDVKTKQWLNDDNMQKYLRPETLFGTKFEAYLNESIQSSSQPKAQQSANHNHFDFNLTRGE